MLPTVLTFIRIREWKEWVGGVGMRKVSGLQTGREGKVKNKETGNIPFPLRN